MSKVVLRLIEIASGQRTEFDGKFVEAYDPTFHPEGEEYDGGILLVTSDPRQAMQFENAAAAVAKWQEAYGTRPDGEPDRPLTAWTIQILPVDEANDEKERPAQL